MEGEAYSTLRPAISVCVLDAVLFRKTPDLHLDFRLRERTHHHVLTDDVQVHLLQLPGLVAPAKNERIVDPLQQWAFFFRFALVIQDLFSLPFLLPLLAV